MSLQWTLVAGVMYAELAATIILLIPFISPSRWNTFFKSRFLKSIGSMGHIYFKIFMGILVLFFLDAIREMRKYGTELDTRGHSDHGTHLDADMQAHMRLFRAQRNFYISGFSLFLCFVLQRLMSLISDLAVTQAGKEAAMKQAEGASAAASQLLKGTTKDGGAKKGDVAEDDEIKKLSEKNQELRKENTALVSQAKAVSNEYDRLLKEHSELQDKYKTATKSGSDKKDD